MSVEVLSKALDPFFTTKSIGKGSGMGLTQAYGFARQASGALILHSRPEEGTMALLYLPKAEHAAQSREAERHALPRAASGGIILFVEDDPLVRDVVQPALEAAGFQIVTAQDGDEALAQLTAGRHFNAVFSDIVMPGRISGIDLAEIIQRRFPGIRVVLATGYSDRRVSLPGVRIIAKPYDVADIVNALNGGPAVEQNRAASPNIDG
jgi:CheY-like chemotaxis protein